MDLSRHSSNGQDSSEVKITDSFSVKTEPQDYVENGPSLENEGADIHITSSKHKSPSKRSLPEDIAVKVESLPLQTKKEKKERVVKPKTDAKATNKVVKQEKTVKKEVSVKAEKGMKQEMITDFVPEKKKRDRFHGLSEEEVLLRLLPDHLAHDLDIIIIGINPGLTAAYVGHHYAGPGNHFWKCLYLAGFIPQPMNAYDDYKLKDYGIGFTNIVARTTRGSADLTKKEIKEGADILTEKILKYHPKIAVFNGKGIYEVFCGNKNFNFGKQPEPFPGTSCHVYVMPSSSARCTQLPRAIDKVPFYSGLRMLRDHLRGDLPDLDDSQVTFPDVELKVAPRKIKPEELDANGVKIETGDASKETGKTKAGVKREVKNEKSSDGMDKPKAKRGRKPKALNPDTEIEKLPENGAYNSSELSMPSLQRQSIEDMPLGVPFPSDPNYLVHKSTQLEPLTTVKQEVEHDDYNDRVPSRSRATVTSSATPSNLVSGWLQGFNGGGGGDLDTVSPYFSRNSMLSSLQNNGGAQFGSFEGYNAAAHNAPFGNSNPTGSLLNTGAYGINPNLSTGGSMSNRLRSFSHSNYPMIEDNYLFASNPHAVFQAAGPTLVALDSETERYIQDISEGIPQDMLANSKSGARSRQSL